MKKPQNNYAFIDGNNLHLTFVYLGWPLDYRKFRVYLKEHWGVVKAYYFVGYIPKNKDLYDFLESVGYTMKYKQVSNIKREKTKGNIDPELVLQAMIDISEYDKAVLVSSDGDFACLVNYWREKGKYECVLAPCRNGCSHLLRKAARERLYFIDGLRGKLQYKKQRGTS